MDSYSSVFAIKQNISELRIVSAQDNIGDIVDCYANGPVSKQHR